MNFIKNLQNKPEHFKRIVMWLGISFIMASIFIFWLINFPSQIPVPVNNLASDNLTKELPGIWQALNKQFGNLKNLWPK